MIYYKAGYKYQLNTQYSCMTGIKVPDKIVKGFLILDIDGRLHIKVGYAWDGPSGPAIDTKNFMRGSLVHDALYQLIRNGLLGSNSREKADRLLQQICREDGMSKLRAWWVYKALHWFGSPAAEEAGKREILTAP